MALSEDYFMISANGHHKCWYCGRTQPSKWRPCKHLLLHEHRFQNRNKTKNLEWTMKCLWIRGFGTTRRKDVLLVLKKKNELPHEMRTAIESFEWDPLASKHKARWFLYRVAYELEKIIQAWSDACMHRRDLKVLKDYQWDPQEFKTALQLFPYTADKFPIDRSFDSLFWPKGAALLPIIAQAKMDHGIFGLGWDHDEYYKFIKKLVMEETHENECMEVLKDLKSRNLLMVERIVEVVCQNWAYSYHTYLSYVRNERFRYLVMILPADKRKSYCNRFALHNDPCFAARLFWFPTEMGRFFVKERVIMYSCDRSSITRKVVDYLYEDFAKFTEETRLEMIVYAASNDLVPLTILYFLLRREPHLIQFPAVLVGPSLHPVVFGQNALVE